MKLFAVVLFLVAGVVLFQGLTNPTDTTVDRILADASLAMFVPLFFVGMALWASDEK